MRIVRTLLGVAAAAAFVGVIVAANWAIKEFGIVNVGLGLAAPAGVFFAGVAFTARDVVRETLGKRAVLASIIVGAVMSYVVADVEKIAIASAVAFLFSETADSVVYEPLRKRWLPALLASNAAGMVVDSAVFLWLAFGSLDFLEGQLLGKAYMTIAAIPLVWALRRLLR